MNFRTISNRSLDQAIANTLPPPAYVPPLQTYVPPPSTYVPYDIPPPPPISPAATNDETTADIETPTQKSKIAFFVIATIATIAAIAIALVVIYQPPKMS